MRKGFMKKMIAAGLALTMVLSLAACGKNGGSGAGSGSGSSGAVGGGKGDSSSAVSSDPSAAKQGVYKQTAFDLGFAQNDSVSVITSGKLAQGYGFVLRRDNWDETTYTSNTEIYLQKFDDAGNMTDRVLLTSSTSQNGYFGEEPELYEEAGEAVVEESEEGTESGEAVSEEGDVAEEPWVDYSNGTSNTYTYFSNFAIDGQGHIYGLRQVSTDSYDDDGYYTYSSTYTVLGYDENGNVLFETDLGDRYSNGDLSQSVGTPEGLLILGTTDYSSYEAILCDASGNIIEKGKNLPEEFQNAYGIYHMKDGSYLLIYSVYGESYDIKAAKLDLKGFTLGETYTLPSMMKTIGFNAMCPGNSTDFLASTGNGIYSFSLGDTEMKQVMNYVNSDFDSYSMNAVLPISDTAFLGQFYSDTTNQQMIARFDYVDPSTIPDKEVLTLACFYMNGDIRSRVKAFNESSDTTRIVIQSYEQYATDDDYLAGYTRLNNDILAGNMPDILYLDNLSRINISSYAKKGLLTDIDELLKNDPELSSETYLTNVFDAFAVNGKHYVVVPNFDVLTYTAKSPEMDAYKGWNTAKFIEFAKSRTADQQVIEDLTRSQFLNNVMTYRGAEFVDPETGKCNFNSDEFIQLLEYTATLPEEINWDARPENYWNDYDTFYSSGRVALKYAYVYNAHSFYTDNYSSFKGDFTTVGFPTNGGNGACLNCYTYYLIGSNKNHVQQAWDFVRYYLTPDYQNSIESDIPVLESAYKTWLSKGPEKNSWTDPTTGVTEYYDDYYYVNDQQYEIPTMSQKYLDELDALIRSTRSTQYQQTDIISIIEEEASALFSGQKSAQDVANVIQSRVQIYVNENQN